MTIFLHTHIVYYRVQSAWPTVHPLCTHRATLQMGRVFCLYDSVMTVLRSVIKYFKVAKRPKKKRLEKANYTLFYAEVKAKAEAGEEEQQEKVVNKPITAPSGDEREMHANRL